MALQVKDVLQLSSLSGVKLISGAKGLEREVSSAGIADYEFVPDIEYHNDIPFEKESFVISSLLFAQNEPQRIMEAVKMLYRMGTSAFAYKTIIYEQLPKEVLDFSNEKNFPIFSIGQDVYFENIIYEIMDAVQREDNLILTEQNLLKMIENQATKEEVNRIGKSISLFFKEYTMVVYVSSRTAEQNFDVPRILHSFYLNKRLKNKCMLCRYRNGLFLILTSNFAAADKFEILLREVMESLSVEAERVWICRSRVHRPYDELDRCLRESWHTYVASSIDHTAYGCYEKIGSFRYLAPLADDDAPGCFANDLLSGILDKEEFFNTCLLYVQDKGDVSATARDCACHPNTIRYRLAKIKEMTGLEQETDAEFYAEISAAVRIYLLRSQAGL